MKLLPLYLTFVVHANLSMTGALAQSSNSSCVAKCPYETTDGWEFLPFSGGYGPDGTSCDYNAPCDTQGLGYYVCSYAPNGTLIVDESFGEECGPGNFQKCQATTRVVCPPPVGVTCTTSCPSTDGWGDALLGTGFAADNSTVTCTYASGEQFDPSRCIYYTDTGGLALSAMVDPQGLKTCPPTATVACATSTAAPTPTPSTACAAACPDGGCIVDCPPDAVDGWFLIFPPENSGGSVECLYGDTTGGRPRVFCDYNTTTGSGGPGPLCFPTASISCVASTPT